MLNTASAELTRIELHGPLGDMFGREHFFLISSPGEAIRALCSQFKGFRETVSRPGACYSVLAGERALPLEAIRMNTGRSDIHIVPVVEGAGRDVVNVGMAIVGAVLVVAASVYGGPAAVAAAKAAGTTVWGGWGTVSSLGWSMAIGGIGNLLAPSPNLNRNEGEYAPNPIFNGAVNTTGQHYPIAVCYGELEIGGAVLASMITNTGGTAFVGSGNTGQYYGEPYDDIKHNDREKPEGPEDYWTGGDDPALKH
jgi:predicted phage tail protein